MPLYAPYALLCLFIPLYAPLCQFMPLYAPICPYMSLYTSLQAFSCFYTLYKLSSSQELVVGLVNLVKQWVK